MKRGSKLEKNTVVIYVKDGMVWNMWGSNKMQVYIIDEHTNEVYAETVLSNARNNLIEQDI